MVPISEREDVRKKGETYGPQIVCASHDPLIVWVGESICPHSDRISYSTLTEGQIGRENDGSDLNRDASAECKIGMIDRIMVRIRNTVRNRDNLTRPPHHCRCHLHHDAQQN